jgi:hypothetical protein
MPTGIYKRIKKVGGWKLSEETKDKMSKWHKENKEHQRGLVMFKKGQKSFMLGKKHSEETLAKMRLKRKGRVMTEKQLENLRKGRENRVDRHQTQETRDKIKATLIRIGHKPPHQEGKECWNWSGGCKPNPYPKEFTPKLKLKIRTRDNFTCCLCRRTEREELEELNRVLSVNHIDFNKNNCKESNLNTLCLRCNIKICKERDYWTDYFNQNI